MLKWKYICIDKKYRIYLYQM